MYGRKEKQGEEFVDARCWIVPKSLLCNFNHSSIFLVQIRLLNKQIIWGLVIQSTYAIAQPWEGVHMKPEAVARAGQQL